MREQRRGSRCAVGRRAVPRECRARQREACQDEEQRGRGARGDSGVLRWAGQRWGLGAVLAVVVLAVACGGSSDSGPDDAGTEAAPASEAPAAQIAADDAPATSLSGDEQSVEQASEETSGRRADSGDRVSVFYHGTLDSGVVFDSSRDRGEPFTFVVGADQVIPGFDAAVMGLRVGEVVTVTIAPAEAYGERDPARIIEVPLDQAPAGLAAGDSVTFSGGGEGVVLEITDEIIRVDANHPLAGETLTFEIELLSVE